MMEGSLRSKRANQQRSKKKKKRRKRDNCPNERWNHRGSDGRFVSTGAEISLDDFFERLRLNEDVGEHCYVQFSTADNADGGIMSEDTVDMIDDDLSFRCCHNCRRWSSLDNDIEIEEVRMCGDLHWKRQMCLIRFDKRTMQGKMMHLCKECRVIIVAPGEKDHFLWRNIWPSWMWLVLTNRNILSMHHENERLWAMLPLTWRSWWMESLVRRCYWMSENDRERFEGSIWRDLGDDGVIYGSNVPGGELKVGGWDFIDRCVDDYYKLMQDSDDDTADFDRVKLYRKAHFHVGLDRYRDLEVPSYDEYKMNDTSLDHSSHRAYGECSMEYPTPLVDDVSNRYACISMRRDTNIAQTVLPHMREDLAPNVLCPWGCTDFVHNCGKIPAYGLFRHFLPNEVWNWKLIAAMTRSGRNSLNSRILRVGYDMLKGARGDFLDSSDVLPSLDGRSFIPLMRCIRMDVNEGPVLLVCQYHDGGSMLRYLHPPLNPATLSLSCKYGDQLTHAVVAPRKVKPTRAHTYNTNYQVNVLQGRYLGVDSCNIQEFGRFDKTSQLMTENMALSLYHRSDMIELLQNLNQREVIPDEMKDILLERANDWYGDENKEHGFISKERALRGCTFVSIIDAINMEMMSMGRKEAVDIRINESSSTNGKKLFCFLYNRYDIGYFKI